VTISNIGQGYISPLPRYGHL